MRVTKRERETDTDDRVCNLYLDSERKEKEEQNERNITEE